MAFYYTAIEELTNAFGDRRPPFGLYWLARYPNSAHHSWTRASGILRAAFPGSLPPAGVSAQHPDNNIDWVNAYEQ